MVLIWHTRKKIHDGMGIADGYISRRLMYRRRSPCTRNYGIDTTRQIPENSVRCILAYLVKRELIPQSRYDHR
jgi:hypothetical protein